MAKKVIKKLKEEVGEKGLKLLFTENGKEGKSKMIASCGFLEDELRQCSKEEGVTLADSVETLGVDLRTRVKSKRKNEEEEVQGEILDHHVEQGLPAELHEGGSQEVVTSGYDPSKVLGSPRSGDASHGKVGTEETDGSSSRQKKSTTSLSLFMEA